MWGALTVRQDRRDDELRGRFLSEAKTAVVNLITVNANSVDTDVNRILESATGNFRSDFAERSQEFVSIVKQLNVSSNGTINEAGIEQVDGDSAKVLVSATSTVSNGSGAVEEPRVWRLRVTMVAQGNDIRVEKVDYAV